MVSGSRAMSKPSLFLVPDPLSAGEGTAALPTVPDLAGLFRDHAGFVAALGTKLLGREAEVDDLVQDVFIRAMRGLKNLRDPGAVRGWLAAIAVRQASGRLARRRLLRVLGLDTAHDYEWIADESLDEQDRAALVDVYRALDNLPPRLRIPWVLRFAQGEQLDTIASLCGCSRATVKRRLEAAQTQLEGYLIHE
jgi:RNA polymerase sigma-70 factor, ECF subfamily